MVFKSTLLQILQSIWSEIIVLHNIQRKHLQNTDDKSIPTITPTDTLVEKKTKKKSMHQLAQR